MLLAEFAVTCELSHVLLARQLGSSALGGRTRTSLLLLLGH